MAAVVLAALLTPAGVLGCGGGQTRAYVLDRNWQDESGEELAALVARWRPGPAPPAPDVAVGVVDRATVVGRALPEGKRWTLHHPLEARPIIAGQVVVVLGAGQLLGLDARTGERLWERPAVGALRGAADDGELTVVSLESLSRLRSTLLAVDRAGVVVRQLDVRARIGSPAVADGIAFLPWNEQMVVVFDVRAGRELARVVASSPVSHAWRQADDVFFGEATVLRFAPGIVEARFGSGPELRMPPRDWPGPPIPTWRRHRAEPLPPFADERDRVGLHGRPTVGTARGGGGQGAWPEPPLESKGWSVADEEETRSSPVGAPLAMANQRVLARIHRLALGLDAESGATRWATLGERPFLAAVASRDGFCLCDDAGRIECREARTGARSWVGALGAPLMSCVLQIERSARSEETARRDASGRTDGLAQQLGLVLRARDPRLLAIQLELLGELDTLTGDDATAELRRLAQSSAPAPELRAAARRRLAQRRSGLDVLLDALVGQAARPCLGSFEAPVAELAHALAESNDRRAARAIGRLAACAPLDDSAVALAEALERLAEPSERRAVAAIMARHACGPANPARGRVLRAMARTAIRLGAARLAERLAALPCVAAALQADLREIAGPPRAGLRELAGPPDAESSAR